MRRPWLVASTVAVFAAVLVIVPARARAQVSPGWYLIPSLSLVEEYDSNVFGTSSRKESDFITRVSPGVTFGYQSAPLTLLGSYSFGGEVYADNSDLNGINRHNASLDFRYLPNPRLTLSLGAAYVRSESTSGQASFLPTPAPPAGTAQTGPAPAPAAPGATAPDAASADTTVPPPVIPGVETGRQTTNQYVVSPSVAYAFDPLTSGRAGYTFSRSEVEGTPADTSHTLTLSLDRRLTPLDTGSVIYTFRYFDTENDGNGASSGNGSDTTSSHALQLGYSRRLTELLDVSLAAGPRITDQGDVNAEARASLSYRLQAVALSLAYARTHEIVTGRGGAQTVDSVSGTVTWLILRNLTASLAPRVSFISSDDDTTSDDGAARDTTVYAVSAAVVYRINEWLSAGAVYTFLYQDESGGDIPRHIVSLGLIASYPFRVY